MAINCRSEEFRNRFTAKAKATAATARYVDAVFQSFLTDPTSGTPVADLSDAAENLIRLTDELSVLVEQIRAASSRE